MDCEYTAGLSLGEYASIVLGKGLKFSDAIKIVQKRKIYARSCSLRHRGMVAILGLDNEKLPLVVEASKDMG